MVGTHRHKFSSNIPLSEHDSSALVGNTTRSKVVTKVTNHTQSYKTTVKLFSYQLVGAMWAYFWSHAHYVLGLDSATSLLFVHACHSTNQVAAA